MDIKNTLKNVGNKAIDLMHEPGFKVAIITGGFTLATAIINKQSQKLANDTANKNLMTVKYQAKMGGYDLELAEGLKEIFVTEGKEDNKTEETEKKEEK